MKWILFTLLAGLVAASPFLTNRALGTKEAYNYSLSVADAVTQFRTGEIPMLVGQTEYAFNGRIHPLRTAPGLAYATSLLDMFTFGQLSFWTLQNLVLAMALLLATATCFASLRAATPATPAVAAVLTASFVMSPPVLAAAYGMDLYMTVLALPFVPPAMGGGILCLRGYPRGALWLAIALAGCWIAHPPVAFWLSLVATVLLIVDVFNNGLSLEKLGIWFAALLLFLLLSGFAFVSALTITTANQITSHHGTTTFWPILQEAFAHSLLPVSKTADQLGDFQLGYVAWLLVLCVAVAVYRQRTLPLTSLLATAGLLLCFTLPVPGLSTWLWEHVPATAVNLTGQWPMQRLYLLVFVLVVFAAAFIQRPLLKPMRFTVMVAIAMLWIAWQATYFIKRGFETHRTLDETARGHLRGHIDLTPISYAFGRLPQDFISGPRDPAQAFRILAPYDLHEVITNWSAALTNSKDGVRGILRPPIDSDGHFYTSDDLILQPGRRYRLDFDFLAPELTGHLDIEGPQLQRSYKLPFSGGPRGFGMRPGNVPKVTLWTDQAEPETISISLYTDQVLAASNNEKAVARFSLNPITDDEMPVELLKLVPLRARVRSASPAYLETPRMFQPGYTATVNGQAVRVQPSLEGLALLPVPAGESTVELRYPGSFLLHASFWLCALGWAGVLACGIGHLFSLGPTLLATKLRNGLSRPVLSIITLAGIAIGMLWLKGGDQFPTAGPIKIRFVLPRGETNRQQPLLVTGRQGAGTFVYVVYQDAEHVRIGVDAWNRFDFQTEAIRTDYFADHEIVISSGALFPAGDPLLQNLPDETLTHLRNRLHIEFDGHTVIDHDIDTYSSRYNEVTVGMNSIGGSTCEPLFAGKILSVERLPIPHR